MQLGFHPGKRMQLALLMLSATDQHDQGNHAESEQRQKQIMGCGLILLQKEFAGPHIG